jgi:hypothetical protein
LIEPRIYRAAFVPALLAVVLVMFSLESRPKPLPQGLAADVLFDGEQAAASARELADSHPDRSPGSRGNEAVAGEVEQAFTGSGFAAEVQRFQHEGRELLNVIGRRAGRSRRQVLVIAPRDGPGAPDVAGSAADTAALMEIARVFEGRPSEKSLILASVDGSTLGEVGVRALLDEVDGPDLVTGVIVVSGLGAGDGPPAIVGWGEGTTRSGIGLQRTLAESLREELDAPAAGASPAGQVARLAFPVGIGGQALLLDEGYDAVRLSGDGELSDASVAEPVDEERLGGLGRATLRAITALDQGPAPRRGPESYVTVVNQVMPAWVLVVLAGTLMLPVLAAGIDAFARARRRNAPVGPWLAWLAAGVAPFLVGYLAAKLLGLVNATPEAPPAPVAPDLHPLDVPAIAVMLGLVAVVAISWIALRRLFGPPARELDDSAAAGAGVAVALALGMGSVLLWLLNPFAALFVAPAIHLWMLAVVVEPAPARRVRIGLVAAGLVLPVLLAVYGLFVLEVDPLSELWYLILLAVGGPVGILDVAVAATFASTLASVIAIGRRRPSGGGRDQIAPPTTRGPLSYAGPGSLGGTESALRR